MAVAGLVRQKIGMSISLCGSGFLCSREQTSTVHFEDTCLIAAHLWIIIILFVY